MAIIVLAVFAMIGFVGIYVLSCSIIKEQKEYNEIAVTLNTSSTGFAIVNKPQS
jgi:hypothetical protein